MIYEELRNFICMSASAEVIEVFDQGIVVLDKYEVPDYMNLFDTTIGQNTERSDQDVLDQLTATLDSIVSYILTMQGVELIEDTSLSKKIVFAEGIFDLGYYEDQAIILNTFETDETMSEKVCTLLALVTVYQIEELLPYVESIQEGFAEGFKERMQLKIEALGKTAEDVKKQIAAYIKFKSFLGDRPIYADKYFKQIGSIGLAYEEYVKLYVMDHNDKLSIMSPSVVAEDLVALTALSLDGVDTPLIAAKANISLLYSDISSLTKLDMAITNFTIGMTHAQT